MTTPLTFSADKMEEAAQGLRFTLQKAGIVTPPQVDLAFNLDVSGSFDDEHRDGLTNDLLVRLVPWAMVFDLDRKLDVFTFSNGQGHAHYAGDVTPATCEEYVQRQIIQRVPGYNGGTDYSYVLERNLEHFGWKPSVTTPAPAKRGLFGMFGGSKPAAQQSAQKKRSIVIHVTDGANSDKQRTIDVLSESEARKDGVYFLFLGVSQQEKQLRGEPKEKFGKRAFPFIHELGSRFSNVGFEPISEISEWVLRPDEEINQALLGQELLDWLKT